MTSRSRPIGSSAFYHLDKLGPWPLPPQGSCKAQLSRNLLRFWKLTGEENILKQQKVSLSFGHKSIAFENIQALAKTVEKHIVTNETVGSYSLKSLKQKNIEKSELKTRTDKGNVWILLTCKSETEADLEESQNI